MKVYKKCDKCGGEGYIDNGGLSSRCNICKGEGYIEINIPIEQCVEALNCSLGQMCEKCSSVYCSEYCIAYEKIDKAIKAAEEFINDLGTKGT